MRGVDHVATRLPELHAAAPVTPGRVAFGNLRRHRADTVRESWQRVEQTRQLIVGTLGDLTRLFQQLGRRACIKAWIGAQHAQEVGEAALEISLADSLLHKAANA